MTAGALWFDSGSNTTLISNGSRWEAVQSVIARGDHIEADLAGMIMVFTRAHDRPTVDDHARIRRLADLVSHAGHTVLLELSNSTTISTAVCICGWRGAERDKAAASLDAWQHALQVENDIKFDLWAFKRRLSEDV